LNILGEDARDEADDEEEDEKTKPKKIPNQFNFCERAALTYSNPTRVSKFYYYQEYFELLNF